VAAGWAVPASEGATISRPGAGLVGATLVYEREGAGGLAFRGASLVVPEATTVGFAMNRGFMSQDYVAAAFEGSCATLTEWAVTPLMAAGFDSTAEDRTFACDTDASSAAVVLLSALQIEATWFAAGFGLDGKQAVGAESVGTEGGNFLLVYGVRGASAVPGEGAAEFQIPNFVTAPAAGAVDAGLSPPAQVIDSWSNAWPAGFVARFDPSRTFQSYLRFEMVGTRMAVSASELLISVCGETSGTEAVNVFNFSTFATPAPVITVADPEPLATSPICCDYGFSDGSLQECDLYNNTAEMGVAGALPRIVSLLSDGDFTRSDDLAPPGTAFSYGGQTEVVTGVSFLETAKAAFEDTWQSPALPYDGSTPGVWMYDPATQRLWFGGADGVDWTD
jgi:hypothetical protein